MGTVEALAVVLLWGRMGRGGLWHFLHGVRVSWWGCVCEFGAVEGQRKRREGVCCHGRVGREEAGLVLHLSG